MIFIITIFSEHLISVDNNPEIKIDRKLTKCFYQIPHVMPYVEPWSKMRSPEKIIIKLSN